MDSSERRRSGGISSKNGVINGSIWDTRMKNDDVKGGFKVFNNADQNPSSDQPNNDNYNNNNETQVYKRKPKQSAVIVDGSMSAGKRKTWTSDNSQVFEKSPVQISKQRPEKEKNSDEKYRELSVSAEGIKKSPVQSLKQRPENNSDEISGDGIKKSPVQGSKQRPEKNSDEISGDGIKKSPVQIKKTRSDAVKELSTSVDGFDRSPIHRMRTRAMWQRLSGESTDQEKSCSISLRKLKSAPSYNIGDESEASPRLRKSAKNPDCEEELVEEIKKTKSAKSLEEEEIDSCEEKIITTDSDNMGQIKSPEFEEIDDDDDDESDDDWDDDEMEEGIEKNKSIVVKQMNVLSKEQQKPAPTTVVISEKKIVQRNEKSTPQISSVVKKQVAPPVVNQPRLVSKPTSTNPTYSVEEMDEPQTATRTHSKLQSLVNLVMWTDVSRSAFIFGLGTFCIISSSYTKDLNISFISVISYMGLVYLAAIFIFRSIIKRGAVDTDDTNRNHVVGEEEAIWILKLILPYINEFLLNVRALFSGDPATTMKLAVLLFVLARCGSSITIWKMAKLGFFVVFTVPKVCSSYSTQLTDFGTFWIRRFRDAWESCTHKKAVGFAIFTVVWNLSSVIARIWAVFMLFVAFKYYQQSLIREEWAEEDATRAAQGGAQESWQAQRQGRHGTSLMENSEKLKIKI